MDFETPEDIINAGKKKFNEMGRVMPLIVGGFFVFVGLLSSVYSIGPDELGVVQRFGRHARTTEPGLHAKAPFGIEKVTPVKVKKIFKEEFGMRTLRPGINTQYSQRAYGDESLMLTGDLNILDVQWIVQFKITEPEKMLFKIRNPQDVIRDVSEIVMRRLVGDYRVDEVLTVLREEIDHLAQVEMQKILDAYESGVHVVTVKLLDVNPPNEVKDAFNEVNEAKQEKERMINQAWEAYNKVMPRAKGEAEKTIRNAEAYSVGKINNAKGESERFLATWTEYKKAPEITKKRLYLETMADILPKAQKKYIIDSQQTSLLPLLNLGGDNGGPKQ